MKLGSGLFQYFKFMCMQNSCRLIQPLLNKKMKLFKLYNEWSCCVIVSILLMLSNQKDGIRRYRKKQFSYGCRFACRNLASYRSRKWFGSFITPHAPRHWREYKYSGISVDRRQNNRNRVLVHSYLCANNQLYDKIYKAIRCTRN